MPRQATLIHEQIDIKFKKSNSLQRIVIYNCSLPLSYFSKQCYGTKK